MWRWYVQAFSGKGCIGCIDVLNIDLERVCPKVDVCDLVEVQTLIGSVKSIKKNIEHL